MRARGPTTRTRRCGNRSAGGEGAASHALAGRHRAQELHGTADIASDNCDGYPDWVEAARWLERNKELYRRQKLPNVRVRLLKEVLGACAAAGECGLCV